MQKQVAANLELELSEPLRINSLAVPLSALIVEDAMHVSMPLDPSGQAAHKAKDGFDGQM